MTPEERRFLRALAVYWCGPSLGSGNDPDLAWANIDAAKVAGDALLAVESEETPAPPIGSTPQTKCERCGQVYICACQSPKPDHPYPEETPAPREEERCACRNILCTAADCISPNREASAPATRSVLESIEKAQAILDPLFGVGTAQHHLLIAADTYREERAASEKRVKKYNEWHWGLVAERDAAVHERDEARRISNQRAHEGATLQDRINRALKLLKGRQITYHEEIEVILRGKGDGSK